MKQTVTPQPKMPYNKSGKPVGGPGGKIKSVKRPPQKI